MYRHKSEFQKRKERKQREQEEERLKKKKTIEKYFQPKSTQEDAEIGETSEAAVEVTPELSEEETPSSISSCVDIIEETTMPSAIQTVTDSEALVDDHLISESVASEVFEHEKATGSSISTDIIPSNVACERPENAECSELVDWMDPAMWPDVIQDKDRERIVQSGLMMEEDLKQMAQSMTKDVDGCCVSESFLYYISPNGREKIVRDWLRWSISRKVLYCITCFAFSNESRCQNTSFLCKKEGFDPTKNKWHELYVHLPEHEVSAQHRQNYWRWRMLQKSIGGHAEMNITLARKVEKLERKVEKFSLLLQRVLDVSLFLASRNLAFSGSTQRIGDHNNGNFLGILELLSQYDALLSDHLQKVKASQEKRRKMPAHFLSRLIQNEFINICGNRIVEAIITEQKEAQYFAIICDATSDISHTQQNVIMIRYVHQDPLEGSWSVEERFIEFFDFFNKTGEEIADMIIARLSYHGLDLSNCRGQGYDNGANMSGRIKGVRARIQEKYPQAIFCPCAAHTLNLIGVHAAACCPEVKTFFGNVDRLYVLFSSSPELWDILTEEISSSLHGLSDIRWSAQIEAIRPIARRLPSILNALEKIIATGILAAEAHSNAQILYDYFSSFRAIFLSTFWEKVLTSFDKRNKILQTGCVSMDVAAANIKALTEEMQTLKEHWSSILSEATVVAENMDIPTELMNAQQLRQSRTHQENVQESFRSRVFYLTLDTIISDLHQQFKTVEDSCKLFAPILKLRELSEEDLISSSKELICAYPNDFTQSLVGEMQHLRNICKTTFLDDLQPLDLLNAIYDLQLQGMFTEVCIALRIFSTLPLSDAGGERAFNKLALIKNYLSSTMSQEGLNSLAVLSIEHELAKKLDFKDLIEDFANRKVRQMTA